MSDTAAHRGCPPHTTAPSNSISFYKTESVSPANQCSTLPHNTTQCSHTRRQKTAHTKLHTTRYIAQVHNSTHRSVDDTRRSTRKPECFALTHNTHISSQRKQNAHIERATHGLQQAGTTCTAQHKSVSIDTVSLCVKHTNTIPTNRAHTTTASDSPRPRCALEMSLAEL